jgi:hypothetical protein
VAVPIAMPSPLWLLVLPQHPYQHRPERPVPLAVNQEFAHDATPCDGVFGHLEDCQHCVAAQRPERIQALTELALELLPVHGIGR